MAPKTKTAEGAPRGRRTRKELSVDLSTLSGSRLIRAIELERQRRNATYEEAAEQIGLGHYGANYLRRVQSGAILWSSSNLDRLRQIAAWLRIAPIEVLILADIIKSEDFERFRQPESELDHLIEMMMADPRYAPLLPAHADVTALPRWSKIVLVASYQDATRRMLFPLARQLAD
jgi:transcriptional regulator with XRE-family HTH domain